LNQRKQTWASIEHVEVRKYSAWNGNEDDMEPISPKVGLGGGVATQPEFEEISL